MMNFKMLKRKIAICLQRNKIIWNFAYKANQILFDWDARHHKRKFGSLNPSVNFYVIRGYGTFIGLLSMYLNGLSSIYRCMDNGLVPVIDWQNYKTQYNVNYPVNGTFNAWEYYFEQPCNYSLEEVYQSRNVELSGWTLLEKSPPPHQV